MIFQLIPAVLIFSSAHHFRMNCGDPMDIVFVQDTTASFEDDLPNIRSQLPRIVSTVLSEHPGSHFGVSEFRDKPYYPLGYSDDFCYKLSTGLSRQVSDLYWAYGGLMASGGGDIPEDAYQALINIALDPAVGWSASSDPTENTKSSRLVLLITDAPPHLPGDISKYNPETYPELPQNLPPNSGVIVNNDVTYSCLSADYPSPAQVAAALDQLQLNVMFVTPNFSNITGAWSWVNEQLLGQPSFFYQTTESDSSDLLDAFTKVLAEFAQGCPTTTSTTTTSASTVETTVEDLSNTAAPASSDLLTSSRDTCWPCPQPCLPPCTEDTCCDRDGLIIRVKDQPRVMILDMDFVDVSEDVSAASMPSTSV